MPRAPSSSARSGPLDVGRFVVLGGGLAAGAGPFALHRLGQAESFPARLAECLGAELRQPLIEPPGVPYAPGFPPQPVLAPDLLQTTVREDFPCAGGAGNLSVPGLKIWEALVRRPEPPLVQPEDAGQTLLNLIVGLPALAEAAAPLLSPLEAALACDPTFVLVELGFHDALEACLEGRPIEAGGEELAPEHPLSVAYAQLLEALTSCEATLLLTTVPDPLDTPFFADLGAAAELLRTEEAFLARHYELGPGDRLALPGLIEVGGQLLARRPGGLLPEGAVLRAERVAELARGLAAFNATIRAQAAERDLLVYDLATFCATVARDGVEVPGRRLDAGLLGGFYQIGGLYPGPTGHALLAADILAFLGRELGIEAGEVDLEAVAAGDPNLLTRPAPGPVSTSAFEEPFRPEELPPMPLPEPSEIKIWPIQTTYPELDPSGRTKDCRPAPGIPAGGLHMPAPGPPLELPEGLVQRLPLNPEASSFGDALRAVDAPEEEPFLPGFPTFGASGNTFFGGHLLTESRLRGEVEVRFSEPYSNPFFQRVSRFEIRHPGGLAGEDSELRAPLFYRLPTSGNGVRDIPGLVSSGEVDLESGIVFNFHYHVLFATTGLLTILQANPKLPPAPLTFPGPPNAGSTWARFEQRPDGKLDLSLAAHMFLPLGKEVGGEPVRFPLPFGTPSLACASIVARGFSLHPHIYLTTCEDLGGGETGQSAELPENRVVELAPRVRTTSFGDEFGLAIEELGGPATGRSHLMGRLKVQFGTRSGDLLPFVLAFLPPGGLLSADPVPAPFFPPGTGRGLIGFDEELSFPRLAYPQRALACPQDPSNLAVGTVYLPTGEVLGGLLGRAFVQQALFAELLRVEPCTPQDSFLYRGPARFDTGEGGALRFRFEGSTFLPYPPGFKFPGPAGEAFTAGAGSRLDPFLRLDAVAGEARGGLESSAWRARSSLGMPFSYRLKLPEEGGEMVFEYIDHSRGGTFRLDRLTWLRRLRLDGAGEGVDTVSFGGFGTWSLDPGGLHQVSAHISEAREAPYFGILVDGGRTSNVNTRPERIEDSLPFGV